MKPIIPAISALVLGLCGLCTAAMPKESTDCNIQETRIGSVYDTRRQQQPVYYVPAASDRFSGVNYTRYDDFVYYVPAASDRFSGVKYTRYDDDLVYAGEGTADWAMKYNRKLYPILKAITDKNSADYYAESVAKLNRTLVAGFDKSREDKVDANIGLLTQDASIIDEILKVKSEFARIERNNFYGSAKLRAAYSREGQPNNDDMKVNESYTPEARPTEPKGMPNESETPNESYATEELPRHADGYTRYDDHLVYAGEGTADWAMKYNRKIYPILKAITDKNSADYYAESVAKLNRALVAGFDKSREDKGDAKIGLQKQDVSIIDEILKVKSEFARIERNNFYGSAKLRAAYSE